MLGLRELIDRLRGEDEPDRVQEAQVRARFSALLQASGSDSVCRLPPNVETIPGGTGPFGWSPTNPIPVNGPNGETVYLNRIRTVLGGRIAYHRREVSGSSPSGNPVDGIEICDGDGKTRGTLYFDMYFNRRSKRAPDGLTLRAIKKMTKLERAFLHVNHTGVLRPVPDFPEGILNHIADAARAGGADPVTVELLKTQFAHIFPRPFGTVSASASESIQAWIVPPDKILMPADAADHSVALVAETGEQLRVSTAELLLLGVGVALANRACILLTREPDGTAVVTVHHNQFIPPGDARLLAGMVLSNDSDSMNRLGNLLARGGCTVRFFR